MVSRLPGIEKPNVALPEFIGDSTQVGGLLLNAVADKGQRLQLLFIVFLPRMCQHSTDLSMAGNASDCIIMSASVLASQFLPTP